MKYVFFLLIFLILNINLFGKERILGNDSGRYVFGQISDIRSDQYLLDTKTGKIWNVVINKKGVKSLEPLEILNFYYDQKSNKMKGVKLFEPIK